DLAQTVTPNNSFLSRGPPSDHALSVEYRTTNGRQQKTISGTETKPSRLLAADKKGRIFPTASPRTPAAPRVFPAPPEMAGARCLETPPAPLRARPARDNPWSPRDPAALRSASAGRNRTPAVGGSMRRAPCACGRSTPAGGTPPQSRGAAANRNARAPAP